MAERYLSEFGKIAETSNTMIIPANMTDVSSLVATAMTVLEQSQLKKVPQTVARPKAQREQEGDFAFDS